MEDTLTQSEFLFLNQLIADLYAEKNIEKAFKNFLTQLKEIVYFEKGDIYFYYEQEGYRDFQDFIYVDWDEGSLDSYLGTYCKYDDVLPLVANKQPIMFRSSDVFIINERQKTPYYSELIIPANMHYSIEGNIFVSDDSYVGGIGIHRSDNNTDFSQRDLLILKLMRPHLSNLAKEFYDRKSEEVVHYGSLPFLSSIQDLGICIWDFELKLVETNLDKNLLVPLKHREELNRSLITICRALHDKITNEGVGSNIDANRMKSKVSIDDKSYLIDVTYSDIAGKDRGRFISIVYDYTSIFSNIMELTQCKYKLTEREKMILHYSLEGFSNQQISEVLYISIPTVKKHLTNIYKKIGISGKSQLFKSVL